MSRTQRTFIHRLAIAAAAVIATPIVMLGAASPASAAIVPHKDSKPGCNGYTCVQSRVSIYNGEAWAGGTYSGRTATATTVATIVLYQCSGTGNGCGVIAARQVSIETGTWQETSHKPWSFGHTYRACVSGDGISNVCTALMAG